MLVGDIVLFIFQDAMIPKLNMWKLARVVEIVSAHSINLQYCLAGGPKKYVLRSIRQLAIIVAVEELLTDSERAATSGN